MTYGIEYLRSLLALKKSRVDLRYSFYDMKHIDYDPGPAIPNDLKWAYRSVLGWSAQAVDAIADRLRFDSVGNDNYKVGEMLRMNNREVLVNSAVLDALIAACSFIYISPDADGYPQMQVIDGGRATGIIDPISWMLTEGYAIIEVDNDGRTVTEAYFEPGKTTYYENGKVTRVDNFSADYAMLVPVIFKPSATRNFGHSRISRAVMALQGKACAVLTRADITAEFYSFPQKYVLGLSPEAEPLDSWRATMSTMLQFDQDDNGNHPVLGQFNAASMGPHLDHFKLIASAFAGETGLTLDDLGFPTSNPSSYEALRASHDKLNRIAAKAQESFGQGLLNAGYLAACLRDGIAYDRKQLYQSSIKWAPMTAPDPSTLGALGDAVNKIMLAFPGYFDETKLHDLTGL